MVLTGPLGLGGVSSAGAEALGFLDSSLFCEAKKLSFKPSGLRDKMIEEP
jgi:hypothetical protein